MKRHAFPYPPDLFPSELFLALNNVNLALYEATNALRKEGLSDQARTAAIRAACERMLANAAYAVSVLPESADALDV